MKAGWRAISLHALQRREFKDGSVVIVETQPPNLFGHPPSDADAEKKSPPPLGFLAYPLRPQAIGDRKEPAQPVGGGLNNFQPKMGEVRLFELPEQAIGVAKVLRRCPKGNA